MTHSRGSDGKFDGYRLTKNLRIPDLIRRLKARRYTVGLPILIFSYLSITLSWSVSNWLPWQTAVFMLIFLLPLLTLLSLLIDLLLKWNRLSLWPFETNWRGLLLYFAIVLFCAATGPIFAYSHGIRIARDFIDEFALDAEVEHRKFVLIESAGVSGQPRPFRSVTIVYKVITPIAEAKAELRNRLQDKSGWLLSNTDYFWGSCDRNRLGRYITVFLTEGGALHVAIHFGVPTYCLLN